MKQVTLQLIALLVLLASRTIGQNLIAVQNGGNPTFYTQLDSAIVHAQVSDTIYIPCGSYSISAAINKQLNLVGVGHNPDSTQACGITSITGNINLQEGASYGSLTGLNLSLIIIDTDSVNHYTISRCYFNSIYLQGAHPFFSYGVLMENTILNGINCVSTSLPSVSYCLFLNNIFGGFTYGKMTNCIYKNNIFLLNAYCDYGGCNDVVCANYSTYENNIFLSNSAWSAVRSVSNSGFNNNLFVENWTGPEGTNYGSNNIVNQPQSSIFINQAGNSFDYSQDYHLQATCLGKNAGTDGTDMGIYGGSFPWKAGSVPFNPHIQSKYIGGATDQNGNLNVNIKVAAQDH